MKSMVSRMKAAVTASDKFATEKVDIATGTLESGAAAPLAPGPETHLVNPVTASVPVSRATKKESVGDSAIVRETFSMPPGDSDLIDQLRQRSAAQGVMLNRSEILRAGLAALSTLSDAKLVEIGNQVPKMKTGRPKSL